MAVQSLTSLLANLEKNKVQKPLMGSYPGTVPMGGDTTRMLPNTNQSYTVGGVNSPNSTPMLPNQSTGQLPTTFNASTPLAGLSQFNNTPTQDVPQQEMQSVQSSQIPQGNMSGYSPEVDPNAAAQSFMEEFRRPEAPVQDANNLYSKWMQERNTNTGMFALPEDVSLTPEHMRGIRKAADEYYSGLVSTATDLEKSKASKTPAYGLDSVLSGLSSAGASRVTKLTDNFDAHPLVKTYNEIQRAAIDVQALGKNIEANGGVAKAGEDLQLVYMMAKAMDPESVVREGEYATAQKYLASMLQGVKYNASRFTKDTPTQFLTPEARKIVMNAVNRKYDANKTQYENLRNETIRKINDTTGNDIGEKMLTDYGGAEVSATNKSNTTGFNW